MLLEVVESPTLMKTDGTKTGTLTIADAGVDGMTVVKVELPDRTVTGKPASDPTADDDNVRIETALGAAATLVLMVVDWPMTTTLNWLLKGAETKEAKPVEVASESTGRVGLEVRMATVVVSTELGASTTTTVPLLAAATGTVELPKGARVTVVPVGGALDDEPAAGVSVRTTGLAVELPRTEGTGVVTASVGEVAGTGNTTIEVCVRFPKTALTVTDVNAGADETRPPAPLLTEDGAATGMSKVETWIAELLKDAVTSTVE